MASDLIFQAFGKNADLYDILGVERSIASGKLRKAYYKKALIYHPDKNQNDNDAKLKFQAISLAYQILADEEKRKEYDESGAIFDQDDVSSQGVEQWTEFFRGLFPKVTTRDIDKFEERYKFSEEERRDVLKYYRACKGDLNQMITCVMLSEEKDKRRWVKDFINPAIEKGEVPNYEAVIKKTLGKDIMEVDEDEDDEEDDEEEEETESEEESNKKVRASKRKNISKKVSVGSKAKKSRAKKEKEAKEAEDLLAKIRGNAMARNQRAFNSLLSGIEKRYGADDEDRNNIPDDEFEKVRSRVEANRKSNKRKK